MSGVEGTSTIALGDCDREEQMTEAGDTTVIDGELSLRKKRPRRSAPKSRGGCLTCKYRRVKCDEAKPECKRCLLFKVVCEGYPEPRPKQRTKAIARPVPNHNLLPGPVGRLKLGTELEEKHFQVFQEVVVAEISGAFNAEFWRRTVLQACHHERFVLRSALAISALRTSQKMFSRHKYGPGHDLAVQHAGFALNSYQNVLQDMRLGLSTGDSTRNALIACQLVSTFEKLCGNVSSSISHARSGQKILNEWLEAKQKSQDDNGSLPGGYVEDDLIEVTQISKMSLQRTQDGDEILRMPRSFGTLEQAERYVCMLARVSRWLVWKDYESDSEFSGIVRLVDKNDVEVMRWTFSDMIATGHIFWMPCFVMSQNTTIMSDTKARQMAEHTKNIRRWQTGIEDLFIKIQNSSDKRSLIKAHCLINLARYLLLVSSVPSKFKDPGWHNKMLPIFQAIVSTSRVVLEAKQKCSPEEFTPRHGIGSCLHVVSVFCQVRELRHEAISLLSWHACLEGSWDCLMIAALDNCVSQLEEEGLETTYIPDSVRVRVLECTYRTAEPWLKTKYLRAGVEEEVIIRWYEPTKVPDDGSLTSKVSWERVSREVDLPRLKHIAGGGPINLVDF